MVVRLPRPNADQDAFIDQVVAQRQGGGNAAFFTGIKANWKLRVQSYRDHGGDPAVIRPMTAFTGYAGRFQNLYLNPSEHSVQRPVLQALRLRTHQFCPACGEDGTPNTLDHYLPKQTYPEFSITAWNLFPMCDICQGEKGTKTVNAANERLFLHPYFDQFMDAQVLELQIGTPYNAPTSISVAPHNALAAAESALVGRHLDELNIAKRFNHFFKSEYLRLLRLVRDIRADDMDVTAMLGYFRRNARDKSINSWGHVFYTAVLSNSALMDYLHDGQLPADL